jgi:hypothetical protein
MPSPQLKLNLLEGSVSFSFAPEAALDLKAAIADLMSRLKTASAQGTGGGRSAPQPAMEFQHRGEIFLEVFCNPNIWPSPFAAKVLITVRDERIRLTTEAELTRLSEDINEFLTQWG